MAKARKFTVPAVSDGSGAGTFYTPWINRGGFIESIQYLKTDYTDGVDFTVTSDVTGEAIWTGTDVNAATVVRPRAPTHTTAGVAALYAASGAVNDRIAIAADRVKIVLASAGASKTGSFVITVADA